MRNNRFLRADTYIKKEIWYPELFNSFFFHEKSESLSLHATAITLIEVVYYGLKSSVVNIHSKCWMVFLCVRGQKPSEHLWNPVVRCCIFLHVWGFLSHHNIHFPWNCFSHFWRTVQSCGPLLREGEGSSCGRALCDQGRAGGRGQGWPEELGVTASMGWTLQRLWQSPDSHQHCRMKLLKNGSHHPPLRNTWLTRNVKNIFDGFDLFSIPLGRDQAFLCQ